MKGALVAVACLLGLVCATSNWQFNFGGRVFAYQFLEALFVAIFLLRYLPARTTRTLDADARSYLILTWAWMFVVCLSGIVVLVAPIGSSSISQYAKGLSYLLTQTLFLTALVVFLCDLSVPQRHLILRFFVVGVVGSCVYELMQTVGMKYGVNFDAMIWDRISYNTMRDADEAFIGRYAWNDFFRGTGFAGGPNAQASYIATVLPLLYINALGFRKSLNMLFIVVGTLALLITMSRSGMVAIGSSLLVLIALGNGRTAAIGKPLIVVILVLSVPAYIFWDSVFALAGTRQFYDVSRLTVYANALEVLARYPLGIGFNTFSVADRVFSIGESNAHNSWLAFLVETGIAGLLCKASLFFFLCVRLLGSSNILRTGVMASAIGLAAGAVFNENLDLFFVELFIALFFVTAMLDPELSNPEPAAARRSAHPTHPSRPAVASMGRGR